MVRGLPREAVRKQKKALPLRLGSFNGPVKAKRSGKAGWPLRWLSETIEANSICRARQGWVNSGFVLLTAVADLLPSGIVRTMG
jgi:hypothetical protein